MKKIFVLATIVALLAGGLAFAETEVTVGGSGNLGWMTDGSETGIGYLSDTQVTASQENLTAVFLMRYRSAYYAPGADDSPFRRMYIDSDVTGALGLDAFDWQLVAGKHGDVHLANAFGAANMFGAFGRVARYSDGLWGIRNIFTFADMVNARFYISNGAQGGGGGDVTETDDPADWQYNFGIDGSMSGLDWALNAQKVADVVNVGAGAAYTVALDALDVTPGANFDYNMDTEVWQMGAAVKVSQEMVSGGVTLYGNDTDTMDLLGVMADISAMENLGFRLGTVVDLTGDRDDTLQEYLVGAYTSLGDLGVDFGYYGYTDGGSSQIVDAVWVTGANVPQSDVANGGVYLGFNFAY